MHPFCLLLGSFLPTFGTLGAPRGHFFAFRSDLGRTLAQSECTKTILHDFGAQGGVHRSVGGEGGAPSGIMVKLHFTPLHGDIVRVLTTFALSQGM